MGAIADILLSQANPVTALAILVLAGYIKHTRKKLEKKVDHRTGQLDERLNRIEGMWIREGATGEKE